MLDFTKIKDVTEDQLAVLNLDSIQGYIQESFDNRLTIEKNNFKSKMDALDAKLKEAQEQSKAFDGINPDEIEVLKEAKKKNPELQATLKALQDKYEKKEQETAQVIQQLRDNDLASNINNTINQFNTLHPTVAVKDDMRDVVEMLAKDEFKEIDGKYVPHNSDGSPFVTDKGYGDANDWLDKLRKDKPSLFNAPTGGGASGNNGQAGEDYSAYFKPETRNLTKQAELKKSNPALYDSLSK